MSLERRIAKLERSSRVWRCACLGLVVLMVGGWAMRDEPGELVCSSLKVVDPDSDAAFSVGFKDVRGVRYAMLTMLPPDGDLDGRFGMILSDDSIAINGPGMVLAHSDESRVWEGNLGKLNLRKSWLYYEDKNSVTRSVFGVRDGRALMELMNATGKPAVMASTIPSKDDPAGEHTGGMVVVMDDRGRESRAYLTPTKD